MFNLIFTCTIAHSLWGMKSMLSVMSGVNSLDVVG
jgi:hypothetical protein